MMKPEYPIDRINNQMALRLPQYRSLEILDKLMSTLDFKQGNAALEAQIHEQYPIFREFERSFPSLTFALATGVGKTMLMGAFISYLYLNHNICNYFVVAPNLTIYNKLIRDFGDPSYSKYVFKRIAPFVQNPPTVITGDTYKQHVAGQLSLKQSITINIFNIGKINAEVRGGSVPQVKRLWEYIGQSYFDYLASLPDLVVLMDESHHYRADRGMAVINELDPLLGLELTATPQVESSRGAVKFKNVVYEYSLARAIADGFVKEPAVATRRSFDASKFTPEEIDRIKLVDGLRVHRNTAAELETYAQNEGVRVVRPFVLVVCKDTTHAAEVKAFIQSQDFYDGYYMDRVIEVHSAQRGAEKDENIQRLLLLENPDNQIEIVIHVNMLKEGWDVTNLYTIIPLRTAASLTLREQTIGRGLRLPYGKRTGHPEADRLTIIAHDKFDEIIRAANEETSIIRQASIIDIDADDDAGREREVIRPKTVFDEYIAGQERRLEHARSEGKIQAITEEIETAKAVGAAIEEVLSRPVIRKPDGELPIVITSTRDLQKPEVRALVVEKTKAIMEEQRSGQINMNQAAIETKIEQVTAPLIEQRIRGSIDIPDIVLVNKGEQELIIDDFAVDTYFLRYDAPQGEIHIENLADNEVTTIAGGGFLTAPDINENLILSELLNLDRLISYRKHAELLYKIISEALTHIGRGKSDEELIQTVFYYKKDIARALHEQIRRHSRLSEPEREVRALRHVSLILMQSYTKFREDEVVKYTAVIPAYEIKRKVVGGFAKACHTAYKFDSVPEHEFSIVLERSERVEKWLRPATGQFKIHWQGAQLYEPDFVAETPETIWIVEIKAHNRADDNEVQMKAKAAQAYCKHVNALYAGTGKKRWRYILLVDREIARNMDFETFEGRAGMCDGTSL